MRAFFPFQARLPHVPTLECDTHAYHSTECDLVFCHGINDYGGKFAVHADKFLDAGVRTTDTSTKSMRERELIVFRFCCRRLCSTESSCPTYQAMAGQPAFTSTRLAWKPSPMPFTPSSKMSRCKTRASSKNKEGHIPRREKYLWPDSRSADSPRR